MYKPDQTGRGIFSIRAARYSALAIVLVLGFNTPLNPAAYIPVPNIDNATNPPLKMAGELTPDTQISVKLPLKRAPAVHPRIKPKTTVQLASYRSMPSQSASKSHRQIETNPSVKAYAPPAYLNHNTGPRISDRKLFGSVEIGFSDARKIKSWNSSYAKFVSDTDHIKKCMNNDQFCQNAALDNWARDLRSVRGQSRSAILHHVNLRANAKPYVMDANVYGRSDYWASPSEFLNNSGDCEDFALLKFASLLALGIDNRDMRLVIGRLQDGTPHAVLAVKSAGQEVILDNRTTQVFAANSAARYIPKYSMNLTDRWSHIMPKTKVS